MGYIQKDAFRTMLLSYVGMVLGYVNKGFLFIFLLTSDQVGLINLVIAVGLLLAQMSNLGSIYAVWKFFPFFRNESKKHYGFLFMNMLIVAVGIILFLIITLLLKTEITSFYLDKSALFVDYFFLILPIGASMVYFYLFENYMRGMNKNILPVFLNEFMLRVLLTILLICFAFQWISFNQLIYTYAYTHFIPPTILLIYLIQKKEITFSLKAISIPKRFKRIIINYSAYSYINSIGIIIVLTLDAMMLASMVGLNATGVYTTIIYLISAIQVPYKSLIRTSSPLIPVYWKEKKLTEMNALYKQVSSISLIISLFLFAVIWINRIDLFSLLKPEYMQGIEVFLFLMIGRILDMYFGLNGTIFLTSKKYKYEIIFTLVMIGLVFGLNLLLIPSLGMKGAAISTAIALITFNLGRMIFIYYSYNMHPFEVNQLKVILLFFGLLFSIEFFAPTISNLFLAVSARVIVFSIAFLAPIYFLNWNSDIVLYLNNGFKFLKKKFSRI